jgi:branched-chain amino acid aminotransferase
MSDYIQANTNGKLHDATEPSISPLDRSFLYGDSIYEVVRTYDGVLFAFDEHWDRLRRSAGALGLELPFDRGVLLTEIRRTVSAYFEKIGEKVEVNVRLQISRGAGAIGLDTAFADRPLYTLIVRKLSPWPEEKIRKGATLAVSKTLYRNSVQTLNPAWKTGNYLNNLLCLREARLKGADEVLILNLDGAVSEASVCNVFFINGKKLLTPPSIAGILEGITRMIVLREAALAWKLDVSEEPIYPAQFDEFDECFMTSTTKEIAPVASIDDVKFKVGKGTLTSRIRKMFTDYVKQHNEQRVEMRII